MQTVYVKPSEGGRVRQPERNSRVMPDIGDLVPRNSYYERLIIGKDVIVCDPPEEKVAAKTGAASASAAPVDQRIPAAEATALPAARI
jgi:hypothetical protein